MRKSIQPSRIYLERSTLRISRPATTVGTHMVHNRIHSIMNSLLMTKVIPKVLIDKRIFCTTSQSHYKKDKLTAILNRNSQRP